MKLMLGVIFVLATVAGALAQDINVTAIHAILSGYTGGAHDTGLPSDNYLTTLATTLTSGFMTSIGDIVGNTTDVLGSPASYEAFLRGLEDEFCTEAYVNASRTKPARIIGPEIDLQFSGGACLLNEADFLKKTGDVSVDCVSPAVVIDILPAKITAPYKKAAKFTDKECKLQKQFGDASDNVVYVLDQGVFNISGLVDTLQTGLLSVLGEFSSLAGGVVSSPSVSPILQTVNTATAFLG